ncbi:MAG: nodulation protein NfeD, partial [Halomonadaceae bacterium]
EKNVIDIRASNLQDLMEQAHGMEVDMDGNMRTLNLDNVDFNRIEKDWRTQFLTVITDPSVAYILMLIGIYGLILEFYNPGMGVPGVVGGISLLLGLYALQMLPISFVGLGLMLLGIALMVVEAFAPSFGIFGLGGAAAFVVGSIMLMDTDVPGYQIAMPLIAAVAVSTFVIMVFVLRMALQSRKAVVVSGAEGMVGSSAIATEDFTEEGHVRAWGEMWKATTDSPVQKGDRLRITSINGLKLTVTPEDQS